LHLTEVIETGGDSDSVGQRHILQDGETREFYVYDHKRVIVREIETDEVHPNLGTGDDPK